MQVPVRHGSIVVNNCNGCKYSQTYCKATEEATLAYLVRVLNLALEE